MKKVWLVSDCVVSPLGESTAENYENVQHGVSGIRLVNDLTLASESFWGARFTTIGTESGLTRFEAISCRVIQSLLDEVEVPLDRSILILSTTKGNIECLEQDNPNHPRIHVYAVARFLAGKFGFQNHKVVSNACVSGVMALIVAKRMVEAGMYDHAVVVGADVLSRFVLSGFQCLQALSTEQCRPFDADRKGINLGECAAAAVVTSAPEVFGVKKMFRILGGGLTNDANHISGPSRTGEELGFAIQAALDEGQVDKTDIGFISAHGTATLYNDEMEAKAFTRLGMAEIPVNSLKGYFGHTLGAAGLVEVALSCESLNRGTLIPTLGFKNLGVSQPLNVIQTAEKKEMYRVLKTASGFGGCNAAIILERI